MMQCEVNQASLRSIILTVSSTPHTRYTHTRSSVFASWLQAGECTSLLYPVMSKLQSLLEVEETAQVLAGQRELQQLLLPWKQRLPMMDADYSHVEPVLSLRCVLLQLLLSHSTENVAGNGSGGAFLGGAVEELYSTIGATLLWQAELARKAGQYQVGGAVRWVGQYQVGGAVSSGRGSIRWVGQSSGWGSIRGYGQYQVGWVVSGRWGSTR